MLSLRRYLGMFLRIINLRHPSGASVFWMLLGFNFAIPMLSLKRYLGIFCRIINLIYPSDGSAFADVVRVF